MKALWFAILLLVTVAIPARADDEEKAAKQIRMMTALSRDETVRSIISRTFSDVFKMERPQLIAERKSLQLNYGALFLAHELVLSGSNMQRIAAQVHAHKTMLEIAQSSGADWKHIASEAKKMNSRIHDGIYKHFLHDQHDLERDQRDHYRAADDRVQSDAEATPAEVENAQVDYLFWRNLAAPRLAGTVDPNDAAVHQYNKARDDIAASHGTTTPATPGQ
jgi:hypothetical protein